MRVIITNPIRIWQPRFKKRLITTEEELDLLIEKEFPGLKRNPRFNKLLLDAKLHHALSKKLVDRQFLKPRELTCLVHEFSMNREENEKFQTLRLLISDYVRNSVKPRLYCLLEQAVSKTKSRRKIIAIHKKNNGVSSLNGVVNRLATYFPTAELANSPSFSKKVTQVSRYFRALELLEQGGLFADVARELNIWHSVVSRWFNNQMRPDLVHLASNIPSKNPRVNRAWLPTKMESGNTCKPKGFIRVPFFIRNWFEIKTVLDQLKVLENVNMQRWYNRFGNMGRKQAFGYILGIVVSDACKPKNKRTSSHIRLQLSKKYSWSKTVGEASCYFLGKLGLRAERGKDYRSSRGSIFYCWNSECSPLITWIKRSCLGLQHKETTTHHPIRMEWLLGAPRMVRVKFLQGLNDGDGWASVKAQELGNASGPSTGFVQNLLMTFDIESRQSHEKDEVRITKQSSIERAAKLPFFLYAETRQDAADKIAAMIKRRKTQRGSVPEEVVILMKKLRKRQTSYGGIAEVIFNEFGLSFPISKVYRILN